MPKTEAQRRAENKYKRKLKQWQVRLTPEEFEAVEVARGPISRRKWLSQIALQEINKQN